MFAIQPYCTVHSHLENTDTNISFWLILMAGPKLWNGAARLTLVFLRRVCVAKEISYAEVVV